jgi:hypothetical protein
MTEGSSRFLMGLQSSVIMVSLCQGVIMVGLNNISLAYLSTQFLRAIVTDEQVVIILN